MNTCQRGHDLKKHGSQHHRNRGNPNETRLVCKACRREDDNRIRHGTSLSMAIRGKRCRNGHDLTRKGATAVNPSRPTQIQCVLCRSYRVNKKAIDVTPLCSCRHAKTSHLPVCWCGCTEYRVP